MANIEQIADGLDQDNLEQLSQQTRNAELMVILRAILLFKQTIDTQLKKLSEAQGKFANQTHRTKITNWQLTKSVGTPDIKKVGRDLETALKTLSKEFSDKEFDLSSVDDLTLSVKALLNRIPEELPTPEVTVNVDLAEVEKLYEQTNKNLEAFQESLLKQPEIKIPPADTAPFVEAVSKMSEVIGNIPEPKLEIWDGDKPKVSDGMIHTMIGNSLLPSRFDEIKVEYDDWQDEPRAELINYKFKGKIVRKLKLSYDVKSNVTNIKVV